MSDQEIRVASWNVAGVPKSQVKANCDMFVNLGHDIDAFFLQEYSGRQHLTDFCLANGQRAFLSQKYGRRKRLLTVIPSRTMVHS